MSDSTGQLQGFERILAREVNVSDLVQHLSQLDPKPWNSLIGYTPTKIYRERPLARMPGTRKVKGSADLALYVPDQPDVLMELKLGHDLDDDQ